MKRARIVVLACSAVLGGALSLSLSYADHRAINRANRGGFGIVAQVIQLLDESVPGGALERYERALAKPDYDWRFDGGSSVASRVALWRECRQLLDSLGLTRASGIVLLSSSDSSRLREAPCRFSHIAAVPAPFQWREALPNALRGGLFFLALCLCWLSVAGVLHTGWRRLSIAIGGVLGAGIAAYSLASGESVTVSLIALGVVAVLSAGLVASAYRLGAWVASGFDGKSHPPV